MRERVAREVRLEPRPRADRRPDGDRSAPAAADPGREGHDQRRRHAGRLDTGAARCRALRLRSGRVMFSKEAVRRFGIERCQSRVEAETRPAVGTEDRVRPAHIDVDVRVVLRWGHADALEFPHPDANFRDAAVVSELRIAAAGHRPRPLCLAGSGQSTAPG